MATPKGMSKEEYTSAQSVKAEHDFRFDVNQRIQELQFRLTEAEDDLNRIDGGHGSLEQSCESQLREISNTNSLTLKEFRQTLADFNSSIDKIKSDLRDCKSHLEETVTVSMLTQSIRKLEDTIKVLRADKDAMRVEFNGMIERLTKNFEIQLKAQKEEILAIPSEIPDLRKMMDQKVELVELNGQNAVLRSSNNEKHIMLVERKIDNLYQLIKKLELANQETV